MDFSFDASLQALSTSNGGRRSPIFDGYRPRILFDWYESDFFTMVEVLDSNEIEPGAKGKARVHVLNDFPLNMIEIGMRFDLREGARIIATGIIQELSNKE